MKDVIRQWLLALPRPERILVSIFAGALVLSFLMLLANSYLKKTEQAPAFGGSLTIGLVGFPHYLNPVIAPANEVDRALVKFIYPSLLRYDGQGKLVPYAAERFAVGDNGKLYDVVLKKGLLWDDSKPLSAQDVVFTIKTIQDQKISSPLARLWEGVAVQAVDDETVRFTLSEPYAFFPQNLTVGILPAHLWREVSPESFALSEYNKKPVGAGPYQFSAFTKSDSTITSVSFKANPTFFGQPPYIPKLTVRFYQTPQDLSSAYQDKEVQVAGFPAGAATIGASDTTITAFSLPRYFAIFLHDAQNAAFRKKDVRQALLQAVNRDAIVKDVLRGNAQVTNSPIPAVLADYYNPNVPSYGFDPKGAQAALAGAGFSEKKPLRVEFTVINDEVLNRVAAMVANNWRAVGVQVTLRNVEITQLRDDVLQKRNYQAFLFGQAMALTPDPFSFWHSSQSDYPGLNLSSYKNSNVDKILEELRKTFDEKRKKDLFNSFQSIVANDIPALFLYSPAYLVFSRNDIHGIKALPISLPEDYVNQEGEWHIYTKRIFR